MHLVNRALMPQMRAGYGRQRATCLAGAVAGRAFVGVSVGTGAIWGHFWGHVGTGMRADTGGIAAIELLKNCFEPFPVNQVQQFLRRSARALIADLPLTHRR